MSQAIFRTFEGFKRLLLDGTLLLKDFEFVIASRCIVRQIPEKKSLSFAYVFVSLCESNRDRLSEHGIKLSSIR